MTGFPTADQIAHAIVAAARECGEDPVHVHQGGAVSRARVYAFVALKQEFTGIKQRVLAGLLGAPTFRAVKTAAADRLQTKWWDEDAAKRVSAAIRRGDKPPARLEPLVRRPPPVRSSHVFELPGTPAPGRSALDQRRRGEP